MRHFYQIWWFNFILNTADAHFGLGHNAKMENDVKEKYKTSASNHLVDFELKQRNADVSSGVIGVHNLLCMFYRTK